MGANDWAKILWYFRIQTDKPVMGNQADILMVDKQRKEAAVIDTAVPRDSNIRKKEREKLEKEELEKMWKLKVTVVPEVSRTPIAVTPELGEWLQQIPSEISVQKSAVQGTPIFQAGRTQAWRSEKRPPPEAGR